MVLAQDPPEASRQDSTPAHQTRSGCTSAEGRRPAQTGRGSGPGGSANSKHLPGELLPEAKPSYHSPEAPASHSLLGSSQCPCQRALLPQPCSRARAWALAGSSQSPGPVCRRTWILRSRAGFWKSREVSCAGYNLEQRDQFQRGTLLPPQSL